MIFPSLVNASGIPRGGQIHTWARSRPRKSPNCQIQIPSQHYGPLFYYITLYSTLRISTFFRKTTARPLNRLQRQLSFPPFHSQVRNVISVSLIIRPLTPSRRDTAPGSTTILSISPSRRTIRRPLHQRPFDLDSYDPCLYGAHVPSSSGKRLMGGHTRTQSVQTSRFATLQGVEDARVIPLD
jgi:hypothetical protein